MMRYCIPGLAVLIVLLTAGAACCAPYGPRSGAGAVRTYDAVPRQPLTVGKSIRIESSENITRVSVGAKEVADFVLLSPREVYVTGIAPGLTNLMSRHASGLYLLPPPSRLDDLQMATPDNISKLLELMGIVVIRKMVRIEV